MLGVFAEFETNLRRKRRLEGMAKTNATGVCKVAPASDAIWKSPAKILSDI
jgi:DNA invertase Pin-like site-specific DNA recombinase